MPTGAARLVLSVPHQVGLHPGQSTVEERPEQGFGRELQLEEEGSSVGEERDSRQWEADLGLGQMELAQGDVLHLGLEPENTEL